jgi:hypothetical protein
MDPFAVTQCVSVVHGKLCYEGKLIAAVLEAKLGVQLEYDISGQGEAMGIVVSAAIDGRPVVDSQNKVKTVVGTVADWKTTGNGSPWSARGGFPRMLRYRGAREWARAHAPGLMLGVYSDDEMADLSDDARANRARNVTPIEDARQARQEQAENPNHPQGRPKPPDPNAAAPARPRPPNPMGEPAGQQKDPLDIPPNLRRPDSSKPIAEILTEIGKLDSMADCFMFAKSFEDRLATLPQREHATIRTAFDKRQGELNRD